ncbi:MAG: nickel pincer cofactor biosynthesis protein LarB [Myxococcota bacterium]|jgi:hypothetical protein
MKKSPYETLLENVAAGRVSPAEAAKKLGELPYMDMGHTKLDTHRMLRQGFPEVIFGAGKKPEHMIEIARAAIRSGHDVLVTRLAPGAAGLLKRRLKRGRYFADARMFVVKVSKSGAPRGMVAVVTAGTSDIPVAEEAAVTLDSMGHRVERCYDVGVAGIHRLLMHVEGLRTANAVVVVAGMEGALASVVGGLVRAPVIAVPTSVGYGANFGGVSALLSMLNSCASNVSVVNIDNGFGAASVAGLINDLAAGNAGKR